ncbi:MAG: hypothetical protein ACJAUP_000446 [Cellvibrionaceae bacterium]|jgi:hypothetical protein
MIDDKTPVDENTIELDVLETNKRWLSLMNTQSEAHRKSRDPRLFRQAAKQKIIVPPSVKQANTSQ